MKEDEEDDIHNYSLIRNQHDVLRDRDVQLMCDANEGKITREEALERIKAGVVLPADDKVAKQAMDMLSSMDSVESSTNITKT